MSVRLFFLFCVRLSEELRAYLKEAEEDEGDLADAFRHVEQMQNSVMPGAQGTDSIKHPHFAGNYQGPLYAPHPDIEDKT